MKFVATSQPSIHGKFFYLFVQNNFKWKETDSCTWQEMAPGSGVN